MDPLAFMEMKPAEQFVALRKFVPGVDFDAIDKANKDDFARRTDLNRDVKRLRAQAEGIAVPADAPAERVDVTALMAEIAAAGEHNTTLEKRRAGREKAGQEAETLVVQAAEAEARAAELRRQAMRRTRAPPSPAPGEGHSGEAGSGRAPARPHRHRRASAPHRGRRARERCGRCPEAEGRNRSGGRESSPPRPTP